MSTAHQLGSPKAPPSVKLDLFPFRQTLKNYRRTWLKGDLRAGFNVALLAFPQGIAYALIAGVPIQYGLFGSIIAAILGALFGRSHLVVLGPTNATAVLLMSAFATVAVVEQKLVALPMIVLLSGVFLILGAYLRVAGFIRFISRTVIIGYITVAAALIVLNQLRAALGIELNEGEIADNFVKAVYYLGLHLLETDPGTLCFSLVSLAAYLTLSRLLPALPNVALVLILMSFVGLLWQRWVGPLDLLQAVSIGEWSFTPPPLDFTLFSSVLSASIAIALLSVLEGNSIGKSLAARVGRRFSPDQEMLNMGIANIGCGLFSGIPASGSLTRSALSVDSGANSPLASLFCGIILLIGTILFGAWIQYVPRATLAVIIICIGISLIRFADMRFVSRATREDAITFYATLAGGFLISLDAAIYTGVSLSVLLFLRQASIPEMVEYDFSNEGDLVERRDQERTIPEVSIVHVEGDLFFGASDIFRDQIRRVCEEPNLKVVVLRLRNARHMDASSVMALNELLQFMRNKERYLILSGVRKGTFRVLYTTGMLEAIGRANIFIDSIRNPVLSTSRAIRRAKEILGDDKADVTLYVGTRKLTEKEE